jgi:hypothetical protein
MGEGMMRVGQWVEVRSREEILATLDANAQLEGMPFMPEMFKYCGQRHRVFKSAHKTCDTVYPVRSRRLKDVVHLDTRCDGQAHGGCQAECLLFWKASWLKPIDPASAGDGGTVSGHRQNAGASSNVGSVTVVDVQRGTRARNVDGDSDPTYVCQATRLPEASDPLSPWDFGQYWRDLRSGNVSLGEWLRGIAYITYENLINLGIGWGPLLRWLYDFARPIWRGLPYPRTPGKIPMGHATPASELHLQPGEWVRVKSFDEIRSTCNIDNKNRGMGFDAEQVPYCGGTFRVRSRVTKIINERTGKMMTMKNPCIILEGVVCKGRYSACRLFCSRAIYAYWREVWLERVHGPSHDSTQGQQSIAGSV